MAKHSIETTERCERIIEFLLILEHTTGPYRWRNGDCFALYRMLKALCPGAEAFYDQKECHVLTRIDGVYYEIGGLVPSSDVRNIIRLKDEQNIYTAAYGWASNTELSKRNGGHR